MKKIVLGIIIAFACFACAESKMVTVTVTNPSAFDRKGEMVEVLMSEVASKLQLPDTAQIVVLDADGLQVPYQITYDEKVIFAVAVKANGTAAYTIKTGTPETFDVKTCGKDYPERMDDVAWENDLVAFRTYGPALQASGEQAYGYDIWTKYHTTEPVVEARYDKELNQSLSYHVDHGNGLDCYKVGPTLGGGAAALMIGDTLFYPACYQTQEIMDNGPLRFTVKLVYAPQVVKRDSSVVETRVLSLDAGQHLNKTIVSYTNLQESLLVATGIVLHEPNGAVVADAANGYITYIDPTDNPTNGNGKIFVGAAFPASVNETKVALFSEKEKKDLRGGADGHLLAISNYEPGSEYTYYWGAAWDKADIKTAAAWNAYMARFAQQLRSPLIVTMQ
ncbi:MAG: DUF4861 domain-containing protein [Bacteroides sp.]